MEEAVNDVVEMGRSHGIGSPWKLVKHPAMKMMWLLEGSGFYNSGRDRMARGILDTLFRNYQMPTNRKKSNLYSARSKCQLIQEKHGTLVHQQIKILCEVAMGARNMEHAEMEVGLLDHCSILFMKALCDLEIFPVYSECKVFDPDSNVATSIDLIGIRVNTGGLVAIEIKTGYSNHSYGWTEKDAVIDGHEQCLKGLGLRSCPLVMHQLQLFSGMILAAKCYGIVFESGLVIRLCPKIHKYFVYDPTMMKTDLDLLTDVLVAQFPILAPL